MKKQAFLLSLLLVSKALMSEEYNQGSEDLFQNPQPVIQQSSNTPTVTPVAENPDVEAQVTGQYPTINRQESLPLGAIQHAWDKTTKSSGVYQVNFNPREVIKVITREFMTTSIVLPPWEKIEEIVIGDETSYQVTKPKPNIILIRPIEFVGVDSSITAFGESGHVYAFYVRSEGYNSKHVSDITVQVRVPAPKYALMDNKTSDPELELAQKTDYLDAVVFDPANLDFGFSMSGNKSIAPERVFTDGTRTWFDYGNRMGSQTLPTIYSVIDGVDTPINVTREGTKLVAQATGKFTLRSGQKVTCVYPTEKKKS